MPSIKSITCRWGVVAAAGLVALGVSATPSFAAGPTSHACYGNVNNHGQAGAYVQSVVGLYGGPGFSGFNHGGVAAYNEANQLATCGF